MFGIAIIKSIYFVLLQSMCLTQAIYFEDRSTQTTMYYVGATIHNRVISPQFENSYCAVINAPYQFSYVDLVLDKTMYEHDQAIMAWEMSWYLIAQGDTPQLNNILYFHRYDVHPNWNFSLLRRIATVGDHYYYNNR